MLTDLTRICSLASLRYLYSDRKERVLASLVYLLLFLVCFPVFLVCFAVGLCGDTVVQKASHTCIVIERFSCPDNASRFGSYKCS